MLDIRTIRDDPERVRQGALKKRFPDRAAAVDRVLELDAQVRGLIPELDGDRKSTRLNSSHVKRSRMPSSA